MKLVRCDKCGREAKMYSYTQETWVPPRSWVSNRAFDMCALCAEEILNSNEPPKSRGPYR